VSILFLEARGAERLSSRIRASNLRYKFYIKVSHLKYLACDKVSFNPTIVSVMWCIGGERGSAEGVNNCSRLELQVLLN